MRLGIAIVFLAVVARAGDLEVAKAKLADETVAGCEEALRILIVRANDKSGLNVLLEALGPAYKEDDRRQKAYRAARQAALTRHIKATDKIIKILEAEAAAAAAAKTRRLSEEQKAAQADVEAANEGLAAHQYLLSEGTLALARFESRESKARLEEVVAAERGGPFRIACLSGLATGSGAAFVPKLLQLSADRDPRVRVLSARALAAHAGDPAVLERLAACGSDKAWQVRRAAYAAIAAAPDKKGVEILRALHAAESGSNRRRLEAHLHALGAGPAPAAALSPAFGLPLGSRRIRVIFDLGAKDAPYVRAELAKLLAALPDGAFFELFGYSGGLKQFAKKPQKMSKGARRRALAWLKKLPNGASSAIPGHLVGFLRAHGSGARMLRAFFGEPDTYYLVARGANEDEALAVELSRVALSNCSRDATIHVCFLGGPTEPYQALRAAAEKGGGVFRVVPAKN